MKHSTPIITAIILTLLCMACNSPSGLDRTLDNVDHYPARIDSQKCWSMITVDGVVAVPDEFESAPTVAINGIFSAYRTDGISVYRISNNKAELIDGCSGLRYAGAMTDGRMPICHTDCSIEIIDSSGKSIFSLDNIDGHNFNACSAMYNDGLLTVRERDTNLWGALTRDGKIAIAPRYRFITLFNDGHALAIRNSDDSKNALCIVDTDGDETSLQGNFDIESGNFVFGHTIVRDIDSATRKVIDTDGNIMPLSPAIVPVLLCREGVIFLDHTGAVGVTDWNGKTIIDPAQRKNLTPASGSSLLIDESDRGFTVLDSKGVIMFTAPAGTSRIESLFGGRGFVATNADKKSKTLYNASFQAVTGINITDFGRRLYISDILLSDKDSDHTLLNTDDPGDEMPEWLKDEDEKAAEADS